MSESRTFKANCGDEATLEKVKASVEAVCSNSVSVSGYGFVVLVEGCDVASVKSAVEGQGLSLSGDTGSELRYKK